MDGSSEVAGTELALPFRIIRIGTLKAFSMGNTRPMTVNSTNMQISISYSPGSQKEDVNFVVPCECITLVQSFLGRGSPAICIQTTEEYNKTFRKALGMKKGPTPSPYYDPDSKVLAERYITIVLACDPVPYSSSHDFKTLMNAIATKRNILESQFHKPLSIQESNRRLVEISMYCSKVEEFQKLVKENPNSDVSDRLSSDIMNSSSYLLEVESSDEILNKKASNATDGRVDNSPTMPSQPSPAKSMITPTKNLHRARKSVPKSKHNIDIENQLSEIRARAVLNVDNEMGNDDGDEDDMEKTVQKRASGCDDDSSSLTGPKKTKAKDPMNQIWKTKPKKKTKRSAVGCMSMDDIAQTNSPKIGDALSTPFSTISATIDPTAVQARDPGREPSEDSDIFAVVEKCECLGKNSRLVIKGSVPLKCMAIDCVDGRLSKCIYNVETTMMMRVSQRSPFLALCEDHRERMLRHECCPGCSMFCAGGVYQICVDVEESPHRFHKDCMVLHHRTKNCPHCLAPPSKIRDVNIDPGQDHRLRWAVAGLDPNKMEKKRLQSGRVKSARMGHRSIQKEFTEGIVKTLRPGIIINTTELPMGKNRDKLEEALCSYFEGRQSNYQKLKIHPKNIGTIIQQGDLMKLIQFLSEAEDHDVKNLLRNPTTLSKAVMNSNVAMVFLLGLANVNVNYMDGKGKTALFYAEEKEHVELIDYLIKIGANYTMKDNEGMTCMHQAARNGRIVSCAALMAHSRDIVNIPDDGGWTPIVWATEHKHITTARYLEHFGADIMQVDQEGNVCLHWAALSGNLDLIILCLQKQPNINFRNSLGDTALHIATRQDHAECVLCLLNRGSDYTIQNNKGDTPLDCAMPDSKSEALLKFKIKAMELMMQSSQSAVGKERTLSADLSKGFENLPVPCVNSIDDAPCPTESTGAFHYVTENVHTTSETIVKNPVNKMQSCYCYNECSDGSCLCGVMSGRCWYNKAGQLIPEFDFVDAPYIVECSETCWCPASCHNRVVQKGIKYRLEVHRTRGMGWSVRALDTIPRGAFVCEYIGELISDAEADIREDDSYLFDLENTDGEIFCIDARYYGNVSRFINHLCDPNLMPLRVFIDHHDKRFPRLAYFSTKEIQAGEELGFDYGDRFWDVKCRSFTCGCGSPKCKYSEEVYRLKNEKEKISDMAVESS